MGKEIEQQLFFEWGHLGIALRRLSIPYRGASTHEKVVLRWPKSDPFVAAKLAPPGAATRPKRRGHEVQIGLKQPLFCGNTTDMCLGVLWAWGGHPYCMRGL